MSDLWIKLNIGDATTLNTIMMQYVTGALENPLIVFNPQGTPQYIDINDGLYQFNDLMLWAIDDPNLPFANQTALNVFRVGAKTTAEAILAGWIPNPNTSPPLTA